MTAKKVWQDKATSKAALVEHHPPWKRISTAEEMLPLSSRGSSTVGDDDEKATAAVVFPLLSPSRASRHFRFLSLNLALCNEKECLEGSHIRRPQPFIQGDMTCQVDDYILLTLIW